MCGSRVIGYSLRTGRLLSQGSLCDLTVGVHDDRTFAECDRLALFLFDCLFGEMKTRS